MPPNTPPVPAKRALPSKEASLFRELLTLYETRQLKKGQKAADQILKKFPEHGETMCMKGLILTHMGKREEGLELVKKGVRLDLTSHICWHVFGLIQKGEKNYEEALKSYTQALRFDKENMNILRDSAQLQTHLRAYDSLVETRYTLLKIRPQLRQNWIALAVAYHLNGQLSETKKVLVQYEYMLKSVPDYDPEHSELVLYHVRVLEDLGELSEALSLLDVNAKSRVIVDRTAIMLFRARILSKLKSTDEADHAWRALIEQNPDCYDYYRGFLSNQGIDLESTSDADRERALQLFHNFSTQIPRATAPRRIALTIATGDEFKKLAKPYVISALKKGVPSLFSDVKSLYQVPEKQRVIEDIVEELRETLAAETQTQSGSEAPASTSAFEPPTTYLWTLYFLAQHHSFLSRYSQALSIIDTAIAHTPTLPELYACKGRILKRAGDLLGAFKCLNFARSLDGQDRFLNTKCAKYQFRAGLIEEANETLGLFTKKDAPSPGADLEDMQSLLYILEEAAAHSRSGRLNLALKKYYAAAKVFDEFEDDQYDFHGYSIRKCTVNVYFDLLHWEEKLRAHPTYIHTAVSAAQIWVAVYDDPTIIANIQSAANLSDAEKKAKKKAKKIAQKVQEDTKKAANANNSNEDKGLEPVPPKDDDLDGIKFISSTDPLERAAKLLSPLIALAPKNMEACIAVYDVAIRRKKYLQAAKALHRAHSIDPQDAELHIRLIEFRKTVASLPQPLPAPLGPALTDSASSLIPEDVSLERYNAEFLQRHSHISKAILAAAKAAQKLDAPREEVENMVFTSLGPDVELNVKGAQEVISFLDKIKSPRTSEFRSACDAKFEISTIFKMPEELSKLRKDVFAADEVENEEKPEVIA